MASWTPGDLGQNLVLEKLEGDVLVGHIIC